MSNVIKNPILRGFNPDPSICRVGDDYYIATSTFEWYPGVQIHHSKDLINWRLITRPLNRESQLNMLGNPCSCGVWAPCLTYHDGLFYLLYTDVKRHDLTFKDTHNYLVTSDTIDGDWSDPVYINSSGFDPSLFHDDDGKKYVVNLIWNHLGNGSPFGGIVLQEYSPERKNLTGPVTKIFQGTELGCTEGAHIYKWNGYYYLITAEGGTGYRHAVTMARSRTITGPYEVDPVKYICTSKDEPGAYLQRAGHGDIVETKEGEYCLVHLCSRPLGERDRSPLGRETAIQRLKWTEEGWLRLADGGVIPHDQVASPVKQLHPWPDKPPRDEFDDKKLAIDFQWLRTPWPDGFFSLSERPGYLRLVGRESIGSWFTQALIARRQQDFCYTATTKMEFEPDNFQQMAGLVCYYNTHKFHYLYISKDEDGGKYIAIMCCNGDVSKALQYPLDEDVIYIDENMPVWLRAEIDFEKLFFYWSLDDTNWHQIPVQLDASILSDESGNGAGANFTGAFVGMCCQDLSGQKKNADFDFFEYIGRDKES